MKVSTTLPTSWPKSGEFPTDPDHTGVSWQLHSATGHSSVGTMLLETKTLRPQAPPQLLNRAPLLENLSRLYQHPLTLVCAPAGYGKTTLISLWLEQHRATAGWVTLDERDNEEALFWQYICHALGRIDRRFSQPMVHFERGREEQLDLGVNQLVHELLEYSRSWRAQEKVILVLDDFHLIHNPNLLARFNRFLDYCPVSVHCVITARSEPRLDLARRKVRAQVLDISPAQLKLSLQETETFLALRMNLSLSPLQLNQLYAKTEGWMAATQLAGMSLQTPLNPADPLSLIGSDDRDLSDYLLHQVFHLQSQEMQDFLVLTSFLPKLCSSLCDQVLQWSRSEKLLDQLATRHLLIQHLESGWYRLHDLIREWLLQRLNAKDHEFITILRRRSARWFESQDMLLDAIEQLVWLQDWDAATQLIVPGFNMIAQAGAFVNGDWLCRKFPRTIIHNNPWLCCLQAATALSRDDNNLVISSLQQAEVLLAQPDTDALARQTLPPLIAFFYSHVARLNGDYLQASRLLQSNQHANNDDDPYYHWTLHGLGGDAYARGDLPEAEEHLTSAMHLARRRGDQFCQINTLFWLMPTLLHRGRLNKAQEWIDVIEQELGRSSSDLVNTGAIPYCRAMIYREKNRLEEALEYAETANLAAANQHPVNRLYRQFWLMMIHSCLGDFAKARQHLNQLTRIHEALGTRWRHPLPEPESFYGLLSLLEGNPMRLITWSNRVLSPEDQEPPARYNSENQLRLLAQVVQGRLDPELLASTRAIAQQNDNQFVLLQTFCLEAMFLFSRGRQAEALEVTQTVLAMSRKYGFVRTVLDNGPMMSHLLTLCLQQGLEIDTAERLLLSAGVKSLPPKISEKPLLVESLSERELQLLQLLSTGQTNQDLAGTLGIAAATVKAHLRNIYGKLGARNRTSALARARELGLLA